MPEDNQVIIGSITGKFLSKATSLVVLYEEKTFHFDNIIDALPFYKAYNGEAYLWNMKNNNDEVELIEAKISNVYAPA